MRYEFAVFLFSGEEIGRGRGPCPRVQKQKKCRPACCVLLFAAHCVNVHLTLLACAVNFRFLRARESLRGESVPS